MVPSWCLWPLIANVNNMILWKCTCYFQGLVVSVCMNLWWEVIGWCTCSKILHRYWSLHLAFWQYACISEEMTRVPTMDSGGKTSTHVTPVAFRGSQLYRIFKTKVSLLGFTDISNSHEQLYINSLGFCFRHKYFDQLFWSGACTVVTMTHKAVIVTYS